MIKLRKVESVDLNLENDVYERTVLNHRISFLGITLWKKVYDGRCNAKGEGKASKESGFGFKKT